MIMEQGCGPLAVEIIPGKHCDFSTYLAKRAKALSGECAEVKFPDYEHSCGVLAVEIFPGKHCDFSTYLEKRAKAQSGACAEVQFPDYGTVLWTTGSRNISRKALRFKQLSCQVSESSISSMRRVSISSLWNRALVTLQ
jgi:hypothetical protein